MSGTLAIFETADSDKADEIAENLFRASPLSKTKPQDTRLCKVCVLSRVRRVVQIYQMEVQVPLPQ